jgi:hypothetical protein
MADIAKERAWMEERARDAAESAERLQRHEDAEQDATCRYCFHDRHSFRWSGSFAVTVLWCRDGACLCGISPCPGCGARLRPNEDGWVSICPACGHACEIGAIG